MQIRDFALERLFAHHEFTVPHHLSSSECQPVTIAELLHLADEPADTLLELSLGYTESRGTPDLRAAIAEFYPGCDPDQVLVANAPEEAIFLAMHSILAPGDRVVVQAPCYQSLAEIARSIGCDVVPWSMRPHSDGDGDGGRWRIDLDELRTLLVDTRLLVINTPHNPTGHHPTGDEYQHILTLARDAGARVFCDEMYRGLERSDDHALPPAASCDPRALSLWGMSKSFGLPGLRIGWLVCRDEQLLDRIARLKDYTTICSSAPSELLARLGLRCSAALTGRNRERIEDNRRHLQALLAEYPDRLSWLPPMAGSVSLARVHGEPASVLSRRARQDAGVLLVPSPVFDMEDCYVRFGLGRDDFPVALGRFSTWLREDRA